MLKSIGNDPRNAMLQFHEQIGSTQWNVNPGGNPIYHGGDHSRTKRSAFCKASGVLENAATGASLGEWQYEVKSLDNYYLCSPKSAILAICLAWKLLACKDLLFRQIANCAHMTYNYINPREKMCPDR